MAVKPAAADAASVRSTRTEIDEPQLSIPPSSVQLEETDESDLATPRPPPATDEVDPLDDASSLHPESIHDTTAASSRHSLLSEKPSTRSKHNGETLARISTIPAIKRLDRKYSDDARSLKTHRLHRFSLYETSARFFITGADVTDQHFKILKVDRTSTPTQLSLFEDDIIYTKQEISQLLTAIDDGNKATGGLRHRCSFWGLLGFIRLTDSYYMLLVTKRQQAAMLGGHYIYRIESTELVSLTTGVATRFSRERNAEEARFLGILNSLDLSKNFYFSYSYNITRSLQDNIIRERTAAVHGDGSITRDYNAMYVWNHHLLNPAIKTLNNVYDWCLPIMHGFIDQSSINVFGRLLYVTIVGRRSRFFAGARFLKRGINDLGYVANDVETEQIVSDMLTTSFHAPGPRIFSNPTYTSYVHHRGSIPLYWSQENNSVSPKPGIDLHLTDPFYQPAALHFDDLFARYGCPIYVLNLIKARERTPRESKLLYEFKYAIDYLNQFLPEESKIIYKAYDMSRASKTRGGDVIGNLETIAKEILKTTSFFHNGDGVEGQTKVQNGVARTNCIDCLDRTNAAQFVIGKHAFGLQLQALGVIESPDMDYDSDAIDIFTHMFHNHGDTIAIQYGGSHLVNTMATYRKINHWQGTGRDMVESFKRYYHNSFLDTQRQEAYNLFLGNYVYAQGQPMLWDLSTDYYLHHSDPKSYLDRTRHRQSYIDWYHPKNLERRTLPTIPPATSAAFREYQLAEHDEFWLEYYRPLILSSFAKVYSYRMATSNRSFTDRPASINTLDPSPFITRLDPNRATPDSPEKKSRKGVTILDPDMSSQLDIKTGPHSPQHGRNRSGSVTNGILVRPPTPLEPQSTEVNTLIASSPARSALLRTPLSERHPMSSPGKDDRNAFGQLTLDKIYSSSLDPSVSQAEAAEYERYISHPSNIPLVVSDDAAGASEVAVEYAEYCNSANDMAFRWQTDPHDIAEFADFVASGERENTLTVFDEDRDKKRYRAYRQWLVKGRSLFKQSKVDTEYRP